MPKTKFQDFIFSVIMVVIMVYCMTAYNLGLELGFSNAIFLMALKGMWAEAAAAFLAQRYIAGPMAKKLTFSFLQPGRDNRLLITIAMAGFTVSMMAPMMTLFVSIMHHGLTVNIISQWLPKLVQNFPFALCIQIFYVGPLVRLIFRSLFKKQLMAEVQAHQKAA